MSDRSELAVVEGLWCSLDNSQLIRDVVMKGKFIPNAIKFIANRNEISVDESRERFSREVDVFVRQLIGNKQLHRALHVLKNLQINEFHYLFDLYQVESDGAVKVLLHERLTHLDANFQSKEKILAAHHEFYRTLVENHQKHLKFLESLNKSTGITTITAENISKLRFGNFMKISEKWRDEMSIDVFFKSKNVRMRHVLDKNCFFAYILRNEFYAILKQWLQEAYLCKAGKMIPSTIAEPETFEAALLCLFREWKFEPKMMEHITRREKDVIKNGFAKLGLFEHRESKLINRKLNRFFTTHTLAENFSSLKPEEVTKFVIENKLQDLLTAHFIDFRYVKLLLDNLDVIYMRDELVLIEKMKDLLSPETDLQNFLAIFNATTNYIFEVDGNFDRDSPDLKFISKTLEGLPASDFHEVSDTNNFTQTMQEILTSDEELPTIENLLETYHTVNLDLIRGEFDEISFDDPKISAAHGETIKLTFINYVQQCQGAFATYSLILDILKNFGMISKPQILHGCEEIAKLAVENSDNREIVSHVMTFLEIFSIDTRKLRCLLRLMKMRSNDESQGFEAQLNDAVRVGKTSEELSNVEALEVFWSTRRFKNPPRSYLNQFLTSNDWFHLILLAQYLNFSQKSFITICDHKLADKALRDNLIRATLFDSSPELKRSCSYSKRRRRSLKNEVSQEILNKELNKYFVTLQDLQIFSRGKFLEMKRDLFSIILKCDEMTSRREMSFEDFQKMLHREEETNDLLAQARIHDWPLVAVLAATTKLYRFKFCWITWLMLSSDFNFKTKFNKIEDLSQRVILHCIEKGFIRTLTHSFDIFYPQSPLKILNEFFTISKKGKNTEMENLISKFLEKLRESDFNLVAVREKEKSMNFAVQCIVKHLQVNIKSFVQQETYLDVLCRSEITKLCGKVDFEFLKKICKILERSSMRIDFEDLSRRDNAQLAEAVGKICERLIDDHQFEAAIECADLLQLPKSDFVFKWWVHRWHCEDKTAKNFEVQKYLNYVGKYHLYLGTLIKFLKTIIVDLESPCVKKLNIMKFILRNSLEENATELDTLEYDIILLYIQLKIKDVKEDLQLPTSEYFENVISKEKSIIHHSLFELKSIAKIDELTVSHRTLEDPQELEQLDLLIGNLMDAGDFVEVLRIQEMFGRAPEDLNFFVYLMSIAEGITSIYDITKEERKMISSFGLMNRKFNRLTLRSIRTNSANSISPSSSPSTDILSDSTILDDSMSRSSYRENKETFQALQGLVCKLSHGVVHAQRIALIYRASLFLNRNFVDLIKVKDPYDLLDMATSYDCENKLLVMHDIMTAMLMTTVQVAEYIAKEITACIIRTRFLQFNKDTEIMMNSTSSYSPTREVMDNIWGFSLSKDLHLILELCASSTVLGNCLVKYYEILSNESADIPFSPEDPELSRISQHLNRMLTPQVMSLKKQNIIRVEILITAHECFCHECSTEGIGSILNLAKILCNHLAAKKSFALIVKLLNGIGRYREMSYCFEILMKNDQFEALLGQFNDKQSNGLKIAILNYLNEYHPDNRDCYKMAASHFMMFTELANIWRNESLARISTIINNDQVKITKTGRIYSNQKQQVDIPYLRCNDGSLKSLTEILNGMIHATEMVSIDNKSDVSLKFSSFCELIAMQIHLVKLGLEKEDKLCPCVINLEPNPEKFQYFANYELTVPQTLILIKNIESKIDFSKAIFVHLVMEDENYLADFMSRLELSNSTIESVIKITQFENITAKQEKILNDLVAMVSDRGLKFRLASLLGLKAQLQQMLNDQGSYFYLLDSKYGSVDIL